MFLITFEQFSSQFISLHIANQISALTKTSKQEAHSHPFSILGNIGLFLQYTYVVPDLPYMEHCISVHIEG